MWLFPRVSLNELSKKKITLFPELTATVKRGIPTGCAEKMWLIYFWNALTGIISSRAPYGLSAPIVAHLLCNKALDYSFDFVVEDAVRLFGLDLFGLVKSEPLPLGY